MLTVRTLRALGSLMLVLPPAALAHAQQKASAHPGRDDRTPGHSTRGHAFDEGPRQKPWKMEGIGKAHFPITTQVPEVQEWFDQGITLLHSFWFYEAERTFRWCIELDPECAMAYWGMALAVESDKERFEELLAQALRRKDTVTERERLYIEAWVGAQAPRLEGRFDEPKEEEGSRSVLAERLERLVTRYPDDVEAKAFTVLASLGQGARIANEALIQDILLAQPEHPGAHHYRIHLWDDSEIGDVALASCASYGKIAWDVGHANHMPGHVYSGLGMWREAGLWMESATRIELRQMQERMLFPYDYWNFAHNRNYLAYIQEQQGLVEQALLGARTLLASPTRAPRGTKDEGDGAGRDEPDFVQSEGLSALVRCLLKFERWDEVLREGAIPWKEKDETHTAWRAYAEAVAQLGKGDVPAAIERVTALKEALGKLEDGWGKALFEKSFREVDALVRVRTGRELEGLSELERLAREQAESFRHRDDPPDERALAYNLLGELYLERESPRLASECFTKALELVRNDAFALSGLARAEHALGHREAAARAWGRLRFVWAKADPGLRWFEAARALGLESEPIDESPGPQREYDSAPLAKLGPIAWEPFAAPPFAAVDGDGKKVSLAEFAGKNVVLVFYLGGQCVHCVEELAALAESAEEFAELDTMLVAVSPDAPADLAKPAKLQGLEVRLLSDPEHVNARAFHAWDDFEDQALHATLLLDREGRVRWAHVGAQPFSDDELLLAEIRRYDAKEGVAAAAVGGAGGGGF